MKNSLSASPTLKQDTMKKCRQKNRQKSLEATIPK